MGICFLHGNSAGGAGGKNGGTLTVSAPSGSTVTVSKDDKSYSKVVDSSEVVVFKGLEDGTWTVSANKGLQSAITTAEITTAYDSAIVYFTATIAITYPAGSTCTATCGPVTLEAPDTSGNWTCDIPFSGTWTISITDGSRPITRDVVIETSGQSESIVLSYRFVVFAPNGAGDIPIGTDDTGGWTGTGSYIGTATDSEISVASGGGQGWLPGYNIRTKEPIDFSPYTTLHLTTSVCRATSTFGFGEADDHSSFNASISIATSTTPTDYTYDIADFNGSYYIKLLGIGTQNNSNYYKSIGFTATNIWLD